MRLGGVRFRVWGFGGGFAAHHASHDEGAFCNNWNRVNEIKVCRKMMVQLDRDYKGVLF